MLTSQCVMSTNWLASIVNIILFTDEKCSSYQH